jgi:hypothetical protein
MGLISPFAWRCQQFSKRFESDWIPTFPYIIVGLDQEPGVTVKSEMIIVMLRLKVRERVYRSPTSFPADPPPRVRKPSIPVAACARRDCEPGLQEQTMCRDEAIGARRSNAPVPLFPATAWLSFSLPLRYTCATFGDSSSVSFRIMEALQLHAALTQMIAAFARSGIAAM